MTTEDQSLARKRQQLAEIKLMKERLEAELAQEEAQQEAVVTGAKADEHVSAQVIPGPSAQQAPTKKPPASAPSSNSASPRTPTKRKGKPPRRADSVTPEKTASGTPKKAGKSLPSAKPVAAGTATATTNHTSRSSSPAKPGAKSQTTASASHAGASQRSASRTVSKTSPNDLQNATASQRADKTAQATTAESQATQDTEQEQASSEKTLLRPLRGAPPWLVSLILHMGALIILAIATVASLPKKEKVFSLATLDDSMEEVEEIAEVALEQMEVEEVEELSIETQMPDPGQIEFGEVAAAEPIQVSSVGTLSMADTVGDIGALFGSEGKGMANLGDGMYAAVNFFGTKSNGRRFVFVVDNSNSMGRGKYETALDEMLKSVSVLSPKQQFYVIFFSDTAYRMFHPKPAERAVPATPEYKEKLRIWLYNTEMCLRTEGLDAMKAALALRPDVIYILGDGAFTDKTGAFLTAPHSRRVVINTFGMEVNQKGKTELQAIAKANRGTYRDVRTSPAMVQLAKQNPIKKNRTRGKVWGLKLPVAKK